MLNTIAEPHVLDTEAAAKRLGLSASYLEKLRAYQPEKSPRFLRIGRKVIYRIADLDAWANSHAVGGAQ